MANREKKHHKPGFDKVSIAQHRNEFLRKLHQMIIQVAKHDVYHLITEAESEAIYILRNQPMRAIVAEGYSIPKSLLKEINSMAATILRSEKVMLLPTTAEVSMDEYLTTGLTLQFYVYSLKDVNTPRAYEIKTAMAAFIEYKERDEKVSAYLSSMNSLLGPYFSKLDKQIIWGKFEVKYGYKSKYNTVNCFELYSHTPEKIELTLDGYTRPAFKVGWCFDGKTIENIQINYSELNNQTSFTQMPVDVYIQSHALVRLFERINCIKHGVILSSLLDSLNNCKALGEGKSHYLIEYRLSGIKVGYLPAIIYQGVIVIRSFLFITFNSTPEGKKLSQLTGMNKTDTKYLSLDSLSTFMADDFGKDDAIKKIFSDAGCGSLLSLHDNLFSSAIPIYQKHSDSMMARYLGLK